MRAVAVHPDVVVVSSRMWQTNATALRSDGEAMLVDSPYFPDELELLPRLLAQSGFEVSALLATHGDWDLLLGGLAFADLALGVAESTGVRLRSEPGAAQRALRDADAEHYVVRPRPLALGAWQSLPVPGYVGLGEGELELHPVAGHTADGAAVFAPDAGVLVCGDYLSDVEIPMISPGGSLVEYRSTLARLEPLVEAAEHVVPGHGGPIDGVRAAAILREDRAYLEALVEHGDAAKLPLARRSAEQRRIHAANASRV